ncbi:DNA ligase [Paenibacillus thermotolerans]|uniref:ATP-dependent DNA ligase n=1 Tax=Paenibacillus thermotolerans TaxID=3027807 RepID=UPI002367D95B|nr:MULTISPECIES: DNA ligase [unclassified Paenibacillus]
MMKPVLPRETMGPILRDDIPKGDDWGYQLKWDGVRALAIVQDGDVELYSRKLLRKDDKYPEVVRRLRELNGTYLLDGEIVYFDPVKQRPVFQKVLQRERTRTAATLARSSAEQPVCYVLFDLLHLGGENIRSRPYAERFRLLREAFPPREGETALLVSDLFSDGEALWSWAEANQWEGIVSKRLSAPYREGKHHQDAFKKRTVQRFDVDVVGVTIREGRAASLVMVYDGGYFGRASLGLNGRSRSALDVYASAFGGAAMPFRALPADLKRETVAWLKRPFKLAVTGLEVTDDGLLRHPKLADPPSLERFLAEQISGLSPASPNP